MKQTPRFTAFRKHLHLGWVLLCVLACGSAIAAQRPPEPSSVPSTPPPTSLIISSYDYSRAPRAVPNLAVPYRSIFIPRPTLTNSPRLDQLIHDGKLELSLEEAVELALENNMDITVQRYNVWMAETDILQAKSGGHPQGTSGALIGGSSANIPSVNFDPTVTASVAFDDLTSPVNNPFTSGTGSTVTTSSLTSHSAQYFTQYSQGFATGATFNVSWSNTRASSTSPSNFFNPYVQSGLTASFSQQLLNGFGRFANRRQILIANNNKKIADLAFLQQAINAITSAINAYWELSYARENVKVQEQAVAVSEKLYSDNKKQLEIGTMAPLDVTRAASQLATNRQSLIVARTTELQNEQTLKNAISKNARAGNFVGVEIIPTDHPGLPNTAEEPPFEEAVKVAMISRPDLQEMEYNVKNADIEARATAIALRPTASFTAQYGSQGLAGNSLNSSGATIYQGFGTAQDQIFHNQFPDYSLSLNISIPIRNRSAQATNQRAVLQQRQIDAQLQQLQNTALLEVRNAYIALQQGRASLEAATKARELQTETFNAEQKKYRLGASTVYNVILTQRDLVAAQGTELRALADLAEAKANFARAIGRTLEENHIFLTDAQNGEFEHDALIPGATHGSLLKGAAHSQTDDNTDGSRLLDSRYSPDR